MGRGGPGVLDARVSSVGKNVASWCPQNRPRESQLGSHSGGQACGQGRGLSRPAASVGPGLGGRGGQRPPLGMGEQPGLRTPRLGRGPTSPAPSPLRRGREETPQHSLLIARAPNRGWPAPPLTRSRPARASSVPALPRPPDPQRRRGTPRWSPWTPLRSHPRRPGTSLATSPLPSRPGQQQQGRGAGPGCSDCHLPGCRSGCLQAAPHLVNKSG